jgi:Fe-S cluster assembly protein SufD
MYKVVHVAEGENTLDFSVKDTMTLVFFADTSAVVHVTVRLVQSGANAKIIGIVLGKKDTKIIIHTMQIHEAPETTSDLLVKTILSDRAKCFYDGGIKVEKNAQKTDAYQRNENLLMSGRAYAESKPSLEILANDVRCTHGATTGPVDPEQLWYLSTRGIPHAAGEKLIVDGFIGSALERIADKSIISGIWQTLFPQ